MAKKIEKQYKEKVEALDTIRGKSMEEQEISSDEEDDEEDEKDTKERENMESNGKWDDTLSGSGSDNN